MAYLKGIIPERPNREHMEKMDRKYNRIDILSAEYMAKHNCDYEAAKAFAGAMYHEAAAKDIFHWDDSKVIDFVNYYIKSHKLPFRYTLENQSILDAFKEGILINGELDNAAH